MPDPGPGGATYTTLLPEGSSVDHFVVQRVLGKGGMGTVYLAEDSNLGRRVALKLLSPALLEVEGYRQRFHVEARSAARLNHPNIVAIYHLGEVDQRPYFAMEYVEGQALDQVLKTRGALPPAEAVDLTLQVLEGLAHALDHAVIHRDLKPANLFLGRDGRLRILDFGLARVAEGTSLTRSGAVMGTPDYMAPEQGLGKKVDHRADLYSVGVTLFQLVSGRVPFEGDSALQVMMAHVQEPPPSLASVAQDAPDELVALVARCLEKDPADRPPDPRSLAAALRALRPSLVGLPVLAHHAPRPVDASAPTRAASMAAADAGSTAVPTAPPEVETAAGPTRISGPVEGALANQSPQAPTQVSGAPAPAPQEPFPPDAWVTARAIPSLCWSPRTRLITLARRDRPSGLGELLKDTLNIGLTGTILLALTGKPANPGEVVAVLAWLTFCSGTVGFVVQWLRGGGLGYRRCVHLALWSLAPLSLIGPLDGVAALLVGAAVLSLLYVYLTRAHLAPAVEATEDAADAAPAAEPATDGT